VTGFRRRLRTGVNLVRVGWRALWRRAQPALAVVSPTGWLIVVAIVVLGGFGVFLGWAEFTYIAWTLLAALLIAVAFVFGRASYAVHVGLNPRRVVAGERALGELVVTNTGTKRSAPTRFELPVGAGTADFAIPGLVPGGQHDELFAVPTTRRAVILAGPALSVRGDQLGLLRRTVKWTEQIELFVHPHTVRLAPSAAGLVRDLEGEVTKTVTDRDISFHALRAYEPGDDLRNVHWRTSARTGQLMVRQFEETRRSLLTIVHTADRRWYASDDEFELAVSITASVGVQVIAESTRLAVVSEEVAFRTATPVSLLDDTCRLDTVFSRFETVREFTRDATKRLPPPSVAILVAGSRLPLPDYRSVETFFGPETTTIGLRAELGASSRIGTIKGLTVITVGALADLPRLLRRVR
jgi:uncharacterized protein (DUF58 family)